MLLRRAPSPGKLFLARMAFGLGWLSALAILLLGPGYRYGYIDLVMVLRVLQIGAYASIGAVVLGLAVSLLLPTAGYERGLMATIFDYGHRLAATTALLGLIGLGLATAGQVFAPDLADHIRPVLAITIAAIAAVAAIALGILASLVARRGSGKPGVLSALLAVGLGLAGAYVPLSWRLTAQSLPPINDVSTDTQDPPRLVAVLPLRGDATTAADYPGDRVARLQQAGYPDIGPILLTVSPAEALARAEREARALGWNVVAVEPKDGRIEAIAVTPWFGFRDDIVIRVKAALGGSRVDIRSKSRHGLSDLGVNARRIRAFDSRMRR
ncbi:MAG: DUF1499 domain-containing protein [Reyranellaceae bacterium]